MTLQDWSYHLQGLKVSSVGCDSKGVGGHTEGMQLAIKM